MAKDKPKGMPAKGDTKATDAAAEAARKAEEVADDAPNPYLSDDDDAGPSPSVGGSSANRVPTASANTNPGPRRSGKPRPAAGASESLEDDEGDDLGFGQYDSGGESDEEELVRRLGGTKRKFDEVSKNGSEELSEPEDDVKSVSSGVSSDNPDNSETPSTPRTKKRNLFFRIADTLAGGVSKFIGSQTDKDWLTIQNDISTSAKKLNLEPELSKDGKTITLSENGEERISVKRERNNNLTFSSKPPTTPDQLAAIIAASGCKECTILEAESAEMGAKLYKALSDKGIEVKISRNVLEMMRKEANKTPADDDSRACKEALAAYLKKNHHKRTKDEKAAAQQVPAKPSNAPTNAPTAGGTGGSQVPVPPPKAGDPTSSQVPVPPPEAGDPTSGIPTSPRRPKR